MKVSMWMAAVACIGVTNLCALGQDKAPAKLPDQTKKDGAKKAAEGAAGQPSEAEMKAWMEACTPGPNHKLLDPFVGEWDVKIVSQMAPDAPKSESSGRSSMKWVLDGRFVMQEHSGMMPDMGNMPFKGLGLWGYDNIKKQYVGNWADTMGTGIMESAGVYDAATKTWTMKGSFQEPSGKTVKVREVIKWTDANTHTMDFYQDGPDGKEFKSMTLTYTRAAGKTTPSDVKTK